MLTTTVSKAAIPSLAWGAREPGFLAILAQALRPTPPKRTGLSERRHTARSQPIPFAWL